VHSVVQNPTEPLSNAENFCHDNIISHNLTTMANEGTEVDPTEVERCIHIEELIGKV
jgi:hypothetical protein